MRGVVTPIIITSSWRGDYVSNDVSTLRDT